MLIAFGVHGEHGTRTSVAGEKKCGKGLGRNSILFTSVSSPLGDLMTSSSIRLLERGYEIPRAIVNFRPMDLPPRERSKNELRTKIIEIIIGVFTLHQNHSHLHTALPPLPHRNIR